MRDDSERRGLPAGGVGTIVREWRARRRCSQMNLALDVGVSPRHLSFIETGRSRPSAAMLVALADRLDVPLRERNRMLLAAGHAPRYQERLLDDAALLQVRAALERLLRAHEPYPGLVLDRRWNVVLANRPAGALTALLPSFLAQPVLNVFRASLHPQGLSRWTQNFEAWAGHLLRTLRRATLVSDDPQLRALDQEVRGYANVQALAGREAHHPLPEEALWVPCILDLPFGRLAMFTTLTSFGTPQDITLEELSIELFYPADEDTATRLKAMGDAVP